MRTSGSPHRHFPNATVLTVAATVLAAAILYAALQLPLIRTDAPEHSATDRATQQVQTLAVDLSLAMQPVDEQAIASIVTTAGRDPSTVAISVYGKSGNLIHQYGAAYPGAMAAPDESSMNGNIDQMLILEAPIVGNRGRLGRVRQVTDLRQAVPTRGGQGAYTFRMAAVALILSLLGAGLGGLIAARRNAALRGLNREIERLGLGDLERPITVPGGRDLRRLGKALERMRLKLRHVTVSRDYVDQILGGISEAVIILAPDGSIANINSATTDLLGYEESDLVGQPLQVLYARPTEPIERRNSRRSKPRETYFRAQDGREIPVSYRCSEIESNDPSRAGLIISIRNISERKQAEQRIRDMAQTDALTKVPNRNQVQHLLRRSVGRCRRDHFALALLQLDIDRFKDINDTYGHAVGDTLLEAVAERMLAHLPEGTLVGRLGGDEFVIAVEDLSPGQEARGGAAVIARQLLADIREVFVVHGHHIHITASVGIALFPEDSARAADLSRSADVALYDAKRSGGNDFAFYDPDANEEAAKRLLLKSKLRRSYENNELLVNYQPRIDIRDGRIVGAEALVRWELPGQGLVLPAEFIPLAEETGLILEIGEWVLDKVCFDYRQWQRTVEIPGRISANLSLLQLKQPEFIKHVTEILKKHGVSPGCLELEITETTLMEDSRRTIKVLQELHQLGLHLSIDDFGTGYSSLSALQKFPIHTLKIDRSFVYDAATGSDEATIVAAIIEMGRKLNIDVVAEGVESQEQLDVLRKLNCNFAQGILFSEPMTATAFQHLLAAQQAGECTYQTLFR